MTAKRLDRISEIYRVTGATGLLRVAGRLAATVVRDAADRARVDLLHAEARARIPLDEREIVQRNLRLRNLHRGKKCFVIGTGPSLRDYDISSIRNDVVLGVNGFYRHPLLSDWSPQYYCLMDWAFFDDADSSNAFFTDLRRRTPATEYFVPSRFHRAVEKAEWLPRERTHYIAMDGAIADARQSALALHEFLPGTPNALQFALAIAVYLGCSPIYVLGADHDWLTRMPGGSSDPHFYQGSTISRRRRPTDRNQYSSYLNMMEYCSALWRGYEAIGRIAERQGQRIHVHPESYIDTFPRFAPHEVGIVRNESATGES